MLNKVKTKYPKVIARFLREESGSGILIKLDEERAFEINATGRLIVELCDGKHSIDDIANQVRTEFKSAGNIKKVRSDVVNLLEKLTEIGLLLWE